MTTPKLYEYRGRLLNIYQLAEIADVAPMTLYQRMYGSKMTVEQAMNHRFGSKIGSGKIARTFEFRGKHRTAKEIAQITGRSIHWVYRNNDGVKIIEGDKRAYSDLETHPHWPTYYHDGVKDTLLGWSRRSGVPRSTLAGRMARGFSLGQAMLGNDQ